MAKTTSKGPMHPNPSFIMHVAGLYYLTHITNVWDFMEILPIHCGAGQDKTRKCFIWSLIQSYVHRLYPNNLKS